MKMGFEPLGENLSMIMVETSQGKNPGRYIIETRMDELIKEFGIDKNQITGVSHKSAAWNIKMMATTALLCAFSIAPYIYLNLGANNLNKITTWVFPVLRATGGFITATLIQLLIQQRITTLSNQYLVEVKRDQLPNPDVEAGVEPGNRKKQQMDVRTWLLLCLLLIGLVASIVGYVGCFSVVQNSTSTFGPVSWLCLEAGLSLIRLAIWACNPRSLMQAPPLDINLELDKHNPLPTCNKENEEILRSKVLPLTRERDFLKVITSFAGFIKPLSNPDLSLYYTLTRNRPSRDTGRRYAEEHKLGERSLYITVYDQKERTTRVYTQNNKMDTFYSIKSDAPFVDVGHLLKVEIDAELDPRGDPVSSYYQDSLRKHHQSILEHVQYRLGAGDVDESYNAIEISWTMKAEDISSTFQRFRDKYRNHWDVVVEKGEKEERNEESSPMCNYFKHSSIDRERRLLDEKRVKCIARRMEMITKETKERFQGEMGVEYRVDKQAVEKKPATNLLHKIEGMLIREKFLMEMLLVYEVNRWEELFWNKLEAFLDQIGDDKVEEKERLKREWRADSWKRLNTQKHAAEERWADLVNLNDENCFTKSLGELLSKQWASSISLPTLREYIELLINERIPVGTLNDEICLRIEKEIEDTELRLKLGSHLGRFDQFWNDDLLFKCKYSQSKWLFLNKDDSGALLEEDHLLKIYLHALKGNENIIHITFSRFDFVFGANRRFQDTIRDLPRVTSISQPQFQSQDSFGHLPVFHRDLLFIKSTNDDLITYYAKKIRPKLDACSTYIFTDAEGSDMYSLPDRLGNNARVLVSFVAPTSGQSRILRLKHSGEEDAPLEVTLGSTEIQLNPSPKSSLTIDDITLYPIQVPSESGHLSFEPGIRNDIFIRFTGTERRGMGHDHFLHDIELLDEAGLEKSIIKVD